jgi:four helix bundle protein
VDRSELQLRAKAFALRCLSLIKALPRGIAPSTVGHQLARSALSVSANYRAACRARSKLEFVAKLGIVLEEVDESAHWLEIVIEGKFLAKQRVQPLLIEANELTAIFMSAIKTTRNSLNCSKPPPPSGSRAS